MMYTYKTMEYLGQYVRGIPHKYTFFETVLSGATSLANMYMQSSINRKMLDNANDMLSRQQSFQREMNRDMYSTYRHSLEGAGMNLNSQLGGYPNTSSPSASPPALTAPQFDSSVAALLQQQPLIDAQVAKTQAEADEVRSRIPLNEANTKKVAQDTANALVTQGILQFQSDTQKEIFEKTMAKLFADTQLVNAQTNVADWDAEFKRLDAELFDSTFEERKQTYIETLNNIIADNNLKESAKNLNVQKINESVANTAFTYAQKTRLEKLLEAEFQKLTNDAELSKAQTSFVLAQASFIRTQDDWYEFQQMLKSLGVSKDIIINLGRNLPNFGKSNPKLKRKGGIR